MRLWCQGGLRSDHLVTMTSAPDPVLLDQSMEQGWEVDLTSDCDLHTARTAIRSFVESSRGLDCLFAFVGHGVEVTRLLLGALHYTRIASHSHLTIEEIGDNLRVSSQAACRVGKTEL